MFKHAIRALLAACMVLAAQGVHAEPSATQSEIGNAQHAIRGVVQDALGRPIAAVLVTLKNADDAVAGTATSDVQGQFVFTGVAPGTYAVIADRSGYESGSAIVTLDASPVSTSITLAATDALEMEIAVPRLAKRSAANAVAESAYHMDAADVANLPQGEDTPLNQVLLQAPGVANDSFGQLHIRGDHGNVQYRINGVMLPEGMSGFGQSLDARFAQKIDLLTGVLPAQYGFQTAGVVAIDTKSKFEPGGQVDVYGGSNGTFNPSVEYGSTRDNLSYFVDASYLTNELGIENPTSGTSAIHDHTIQNKGFGYLSYLLNPVTKLSFMLGSYDGWFQVPANPGQTPDPNNLGILAQLGLAGYDSATLNDRQREINRFAVAALQGSPGDTFDYQVSFFTRYASLHYLPDITGNLVFNGVAPDVFRSSMSYGLQADGTWRPNDVHTLGLGVFASDEGIVSDNTSVVFPTNIAGTAVTGNPYPITDNHSKNGNTLTGFYLQDEWKVLEKLTVNYGARFDAVNAYVSESQLSPRLGIKYRADGGTVWHAGFARYFTPPPTELVSSATLALFSNTTNAPLSQVNSPVQAERSSYWDAGVTHDVTPALNVGVDTFYKRSTNVLDEGQFGPALIMTPYNYAEGKVYGVELTGNYKAGDFSGYANLARTESLAKDIVSSQYLFDAATLNYAATNWVSVDHQQALTASAGGSYLVSGTRLNSDLIFESGLRNGFANTSNLPSYTVLNLGASRKISLSGGAPIEARLVLANVFDKVYRIHDGTGIGVGAPQYGARRGLFLGLSHPL